MSKLRKTKDGLWIPSSFLKELAAPVSVRREENVLLIEPERRRTARRRVARMVHRLRGASKNFVDLAPVAVVREVTAARRKRAGHR